MGRDAKKGGMGNVWMGKTALQKKSFIKQDIQNQYFPNFETVLTLNLLINITIFFIWTIK